MRSKAEVQQMNNKTSNKLKWMQMQLQQAQQVAETAGKIAPALKVANE
jgi:hypothetical protein